MSKETETKTEMGESVTGDEEMGMNHCSYYYYYYFEGLDLTLSFGRFCLKKLREEKKKKEEEEKKKLPT